MKVDLAPASAVSPSDGNLLLLVAVLGLAYICAFADRAVITLLVDPIRADFGIGDSGVSLLTGIAFGLFYVIFTIPAGFIADRVGRRGLIAGAVAAWSVMSILSGLAGSFWRLFAGRAGVGIAEAFITPSCFSLIRARVPPSQRSRAFVVLGMAPFVGNAIALIGGGIALAAAQRGAFAAWPVLAALQPWQTVLVLAGLAGLPIAALPLLLARDVRARMPDGALALRPVLRHMADHRRGYALLVVYASAGALFGFALGAWVPAMMARKFALPLDQVGLSAGGIALTAAPAGMILGGIVIDRMIAAGRNIRAFGAAAAALGTIGAVAMALSPAAQHAWACYAAALFFSSTIYPIAATTLAEMTPAAFMGKATVIYFLPQNILGGAFAGTIVALISDSFFTGPGAIASALGVHCAIFGTIAALAALALARSARAIPASGAV